MGNPPKLLLTLFALVAMPALAFAEAPSLQRASELANAGQFAEAAQMYQDLDAQSPDTNLRLNAVFLWYQAQRCEEALRVAERIDVGSLAGRDVDSMSIVKVGCAIRQAEKLAEQQKWSDVIASLADVSPLNPKQAERIGALRQLATTKIEAQQAQEDEPQESPEEPEEPTTTAEPVPTPAQPPPPKRPRWALITGAALAGTGAVLGAAALVKHFAVDKPALNKGLDSFADAYGCTYDRSSAAFQGCSSQRAEQIYADANYESWRNDQVKVAQTTTTAMGIGAAALGVAGAAFITYWAVAPRSDTRARTGVQVAPIVAPRAVGLTMGMQF